MARGAMTVLVVLVGVGCEPEGKGPETLAGGGFQIGLNYANLTVTNGDRLLVECYVDGRSCGSDVVFQLVSVDREDSVAAVHGTSLDRGGEYTGVIIPIPENLPEGRYWIRGIYTPRSADVVITYAADPIAASKVTLQVLPHCGAGRSPPPSIALIAPRGNVVVTDDSMVAFTISDPTGSRVSGKPYDNTACKLLVYFGLDRNSDPEDDNIENPAPETMVRLCLVVLPPDAGLPLTVKIPVARLVPAQLRGVPLYPRATISDSVNAPVHSYAEGTVVIGN